MNLNLNIGYNEVLDLIKQLPESDIKKLTNLINKELAVKTVKNKKSLLSKLILTAPTWTKKEFSKYVSVRNHINQSRIS
jgi:hypothetical protein